MMPTNPAQWKVFYAYLIVDAILILFVIATRFMKPVIEEEDDG